MNPINNIPKPQVPGIITEEMLPSQFRPIGAWAYFGYTLLFSVPLVGFIFLIIFSISDANINRRNFARSYWCAVIVAAVIAVIFILIAVIGGISISSMMKR